MPEYGLEAVYSNQITASEIEREMSLAIRTFETRVELIAVSVAALPNTSGRQVSLNIKYIFETLPQVFDTTL
jgi:predicted component of type VI protein secretion system